MKQVNREFDISADGGKPSLAELRDLQVEYARFNSTRTLATTSASEMRIERIGETIAMIDPARPNLPFYNRVIGLNQATLSRLDDLISIYKNQDRSPQFDLDPDAICPEICDSLIERRFRPQESLSYLTVAPKTQRSKSIEIERWGHARADDFVELLKTSGVECSDAIWNARRQYYCTEMFRTYVAIIDGEPRGWATLFVSGERGNLANAYTQPDYRGRGIQGALLAARLNDSVELVIRWLATDVEFGTTSHRNCLRAGLELANVVTMWRRI